MTQQLLGNGQHSTTHGRLGCESFKVRMSVLKSAPSDLLRVSLHRYDLHMYMCLLLVG